MARKKGMIIIIDGKPVEDPEKKCDDCNYCECETCPTWQGLGQEENDETDEN